MKAYHITVLEPGAKKRKLYGGKGRVVSKRAPRPDRVPRVTYLGGIVKRGRHSYTPERDRTPKGKTKTLRSHRTGR